MYVTVAVRGRKRQSAHAIGPISPRNMNYMVGECTTGDESRNRSKNNAVALEMYNTTARIIRNPDLAPKST